MQLKIAVKLYTFIQYTKQDNFPPLWRCDPTRAMASSFLRFLDHTQRRITVGRTPLDAWSVRRRNLYLTTQDSQQTYIHAPSGIRTHNLSRPATVDLRLRTRGHWDRQYTLLLLLPLPLLPPVALRSNVGHGLLILAVSRSHTTTHHSR